MRVALIPSSLPRRNSPNSGIYFVRHGLLVSALPFEFTMFAIHNLKLRQEKLGRFPHRFAVGMPVESRFVYRKSDASYQRVVSRLLSALATYDAVHFLGSSQALVFLITPLKRLGVRVIVSEHAKDWALSPVGQRQDRFAEAFQMSNIVVATTRIMRENIALRAPEVPVRVIPNVLDPVFLRHRNSYGSPRYGAVIVGMACSR